MTIASLPAYDLPEVREATDHLWRAVAGTLRRQGIPGVPRALTRAPAPQHPRAQGDLVRAALAPDLMLTQTCGYPLTHELAGRVQAVATPRYGAPGCAGGTYTSLIVVPAREGARSLEELRGKRCAVNDPDSHSGMNALRLRIAPLAAGRRFFAEVQVTGSHAASLARVGDGAADVAAVDCVTHALLARYRPAALSGTRVLDETEAAPSLPWVTRTGVDEAWVQRIERALAEAMDDPLAQEARAALLLEGLQIPAASYAPIVEMEERAIAMGYPVLR